MRSKSGALIVAICVAVVVVGSVLLWLGHRPRAAMVGDSLLFDARSQVHDDLRTWRVTISAFPGTTIGQQLPQAERLAATHPKALVLVLGANNTIDGVKGDDEHEVDLMVDAVRSVGCVRWVNVADATPRPTFNVAAEEFNRMLVAKTSGHSNVAVVDWAASARQHPDWFKPGDVHLTSAGSSALAKAISASLDGC